MSHFSAPDPDKPHVIAIGNFDGAHRGHAAIARAADALASSLKPSPATTLALTFEPHPKLFFRPNEPFFRLTSMAEREERLKAIGFERLAVLPFDAELAGMSAEDFVARVLLAGFNAKGVVVGVDFHFGRNRLGTPQFLADCGRRYGFSVQFVEALRGSDGTVISSSAIRAALASGDLARANNMLGYRWKARGEVLHGQKLGRTLGYPTANLRLPDDCALAHGIYAVNADVDGRSHAGVASFGRRPTFDNGAPLLEVHLFDFSGDLYGKMLEVQFEAYLRPELKFENVEALVTQMDRDSAAARNFLFR